MVFRPNFVEEVGQSSGGLVSATVVEKPSVPISSLLGRVTTVARKTATPVLVGRLGASHATGAPGVAWYTIAHAKG